MAISSAVDQGAVSRVMGYELQTGDFRESSPVLPQSIVILAEANSNNQPSLDTDPKEVTTAQEAGDLYGYGSPIYHIMRILRPSSGSGVGSIPTIVSPQVEPVGAVAAERTVTVSGTPSKNGTHYVKINGRTQINGSSYSFNVTTTDTSDDIASKISDAINSILASPAAATSALSVTTLVSKWKGLTADQLKVSIVTGGDDLGLTYSVNDTVTGSGVTDISGAIGSFGNEWRTLIINSYDQTTFDALEAFNGVPTPPSGRYTPIVFKPVVSFWGSVLSDKDDVVAITDAEVRKSQVTNVLCPAPNSEGFTFEASANGAFLAAVTYDSAPHLDVTNKSYPDMPVPNDLNIGDFSEYVNRDFMVKRGASTVDISNGLYVIQDFVTTYHPDGEEPPQFRYVRSLIQDWNVKFGYDIRQEIYVLDHSIAENDQATTVEKVVKPKQWKAEVSNYADDLALRNIIVDSDFMKSSIVVGTSDTNPDRFDTSFKYKRSPFARIASTTATAGFAFGLNDQ